MELPPGFRFHPTDEELITHYLSEKNVDRSFSAIAIGEIDMNKVEPWDLPRMAKAGEREWYFFCVKDKKYPTGSRINRATAAGYWKATGKDKEIFRGKTLVGTKKTLVFYKGRAPKGQKSNWVAHEYNMPPANSTQNTWVLSRVYQKTSGGKKVHISELIRMHPSTPPPLMDPNPPYYNTKTEPVDSESGPVPCFSIPDIPSSYSTWGHCGQVLDRCGRTGRQMPGFITLEESSSVFRDMVWQTMNHECKKEGEMGSVSQETAFSTDNSNFEVENISFGAQGLALASVGSLDLDTIWGY